MAAKLDMTSRAVRASASGGGVTRPGSAASSTEGHVRAGGQAEATSAADDFTFSITTGPDGTVIYKDGAGARVVGEAPVVSGFDQAVRSGTGESEHEADGGGSASRWPARDVSMSGSYVFDHIAEFGVSGRMSVPGLSGSGVTSLAAKQLTVQRAVSRMSVAQDDASGVIEIATVDDVEGHSDIRGQAFDVWKAAGER